MRLLHDHLFLHPSALARCWQGNVRDFDLAWRLVEDVARSNVSVFASDQLIPQVIDLLLWEGREPHPIVAARRGSDETLRWTATVRTLVDAVVEVVFEMDQSGRFTWLDERRLHVPGAGLAHRFGLSLSDAAQVILANAIPAPFLVANARLEERLTGLDAATPTFNLLRLTDLYAD